VIHNLSFKKSKGPVNEIFKAMAFKILIPNPLVKRTPVPSYYIIVLIVEIALLYPGL
jgi:hypothetical protein